MNDNIFRKKSLERIESPDQLNKYIRVTNPSVWIILGSIIILLAGFIVWGIFGDLSIYKTALIMPNHGLADSISSDTLVVVPESEAKSIGLDMEAEINGKLYRITEMPQDGEVFSISYDDDREAVAYAHYLGQDIGNGQTVWLVPFGVDYTGEALTEDTWALKSRIKLSGCSPLSFLFD